MKVLSHVYETYAQARQVVIDLESAGIPSSDISVIANKHVRDEHGDVQEQSGAATGAGIGATVGGGAGLLAGLGLMAIPGIGPVVAAGWLASTALGMAAGAAAGGVLGALVNTGVPKETAEVYSEAVRRGGTLVTVRVQDGAAPGTEAMMRRHDPIDPDVRAADYRTEGWKGYDGEAAPYTPSQAERERIRAPYQG